jgi:hypothetical protein
LLVSKARRPSPLGHRARRRAGSASKNSAAKTTMARQRFVSLVSEVGTRLIWSQRLELISEITRDAGPTNTGNKAAGIRSEGFLFVLLDCPLTGEYAAMTAATATAAAAPTQHPAAAYVGSPEKRICNLCKGVESHRPCSD